MSPARFQILLVEDDPKLEEILAASLHEDNIDLTAARDGHEAMTAIHAKKHDLILLDLGLPGIDGFEVLRLLKMHADGQSIPVIVLTPGTAPPTSCAASSWARSITSPSSSNWSSCAPGSALPSAPSACKTRSTSPTSSWTPPASPPRRPPAPNPNSWPT